MEYAFFFFFPIWAPIGLEYLEPRLDRWRRFDFTAPDTQLFLLFISKHPISASPPFSVRVMDARPSVKVSWKFSIIIFSTKCGHYLHSMRMRKNRRIKVVTHSSRRNKLVRDGCVTSQPLTHSFFSRFIIDVVAVPSFVFVGVSHFFIIFIPLHFHNILKCVGSILHIRSPIYMYKF